MTSPFLASKVKYCIVIIECGILFEKTTFRGFNQKINIITFENSLDLEQGRTLKNISEIKWKGELGGIKIPHRKVDCENCDNSRKCVDCEIKSELNCLNCEISKSCHDCLRKITSIAEYLVEINDFKRQPENEFAYMLTYSEAEGNVIIKTCSKTNQKM